MVLCKDQSTTDNPYIIESQIKEYEARLKEMVKLAASSDSEKRKDYYLEISRVGRKIEELKANRKAICMDTYNVDISESLYSKIKPQDSRIEEFDDSMIRQLIEVIKVVDKENIEIIFKGGVEIRNEKVIREAL